MTRLAMSRPVPRPARRVRRGIALFSLVVAIVLLAVGVSALARANGQTITLQNRAQNRTNAIAIARNYMEDVRTRDPWLLVTEPQVAVNAEGVAGGTSARYTRRLTVTDLRQNLIRLEVVVTFPRGTQPVRLVTDMFRGNGLAKAK